MFPLYKVMCNVRSVSIGVHALLIIIASHTYTTTTIIIHADGGNQAIHWHSTITAKLCCDLAMYSYSIMQFNKTVEVHVYNKILSLAIIGGGRGGGARGLKPPLRMISREIILLGVWLKTAMKIEIL